MKILNMYVVSRFINQINYGNTSSAVFLTEGSFNILKHPGCAPRFDTSLGRTRRTLEARFNYVSPFSSLPGGLEPSFSTFMVVAQQPSCCHFYADGSCSSR